MTIDKKYINILAKESRISINDKLNNEIVEYLSLFDKEFKALAKNIDTDNTKVSNFPFAITSTFISEEKNVESFDFEKNSDYVEGDFISVEKVVK